MKQFCRVPFCLFSHNIQYGSEKKCTYVLDIGLEIYKSMTRNAYSAEQNCFRQEQFDIRMSSTSHFIWWN